MNAHHCWAIITSNKEKADAVFASIEKEYEGHIVRKVISRNRCYTVFDDGHDLVWIPLSCSARGYRFHRLWIDKNLDVETLHHIFAHSYCNNKDIVWI
jgi:hypothetical protein